MSQPRLRYRNRPGLAPSSVGYLWEGDGFASVHSLSRPSLQSNSYILDVVGTPKTHRVKPVSHGSVLYTGLPYQPFLADNFKLVRLVNGPLWDLTSKGVLDCDELRVPHSQRVQAAGRAFNAFSERFPSAISGAEFAQGFLELKALIPKLEKSITQTISSGYLTWSFGWQNLLSDLDSLSSLTRSIRERMEFLKRTRGKPTKLYHRENFFYDVAKFNLKDIPTRSLGMRWILKHYRADFTATASLLQRLDHIDDAIGWLRAITISLGLNNPLLAVWQTTRLSFVIDWFLDVSTHLKRLATVQPAEEWNVYDITTSVVWAAEIQVSQVNEDHWSGPPDSEFPLGVLRVRRYEREIGLPVDLTVFTPSTCTPAQLVLMIAMAGSK